MHSMERQWTFQAWLTEVAALAATIDASRHPLIASGSSLDLARYAFACSLKNRPFQPVDRAAQDAAKPDHLAGITLGVQPSANPGRTAAGWHRRSSFQPAAAKALRAGSCSAPPISMPPLRPPTATCRWRPATCGSTACRCITSAACRLSGVAPAPAPPCCCTKVSTPRRSPPICNATRLPTCRWSRPCWRCCSKPASRRRPACAICWSAALPFPGRYTTRQQPPAGRSTRVTA